MLYRKNNSKEWPSYRVQEMINDIVMRLMPTICIEERDYHRHVRREYRYLLQKYPYADREHLKRIAAHNTEKIYRVRK